MGLAGITTDMNISTLLPDPDSLRLIYVKSELKAILLVVKVTSTRAQCPRCDQDSVRIHSRYVRKLADLPCQGVAVRLLLHTHRFFCANDNCSQRIFCERLPAVARRYARRTERLKNVLSLIGFAIGGEVGARIATKLGIEASPDTLLRHIRQNVINGSATPRVLGIDDWAFRKGRSYGSILVDLERRCPVDLLPDRKAETVAAWLLNHPGIEVISRDRASAYAEGISKGAPQAVQVADRWHLLKNLSQALERLITRKHQFIRQAAQGVTSQSGPLPAKEITADQPTAGFAFTRAQCEKAQRHGKRLALYAQAMQLLSCGMSMRMIAKTTGMSSRTLRRWVRADGFPQRARSRRKSIVGQFAPYLKRRWEEGCHNTRQLWRELCAQGFNGSSEIVRYHLAGWRGESSEESRYRSGIGSPPNIKPTSMRPPTPRQAVWMLLKDKENLNADEQSFIDKLCGLCPEMRIAQRLAEEFNQMVKKRQADALAGWLDAATKSDLAEFRSFARGLRRDQSAVEASLKYEWSNGQVEGQVNRLKMIKRQMYGRAKFDLLRARVLHAV